MRTRGVLLLFFLAAVASACLWDYDTLSMESKRMPGVVDAIVGRFDRNPPLYYEMRLARVSEQVKESPNVFNLYDDAAVACDKLSRSDEGLAWLDRKHEVLQKTDPDGKRSEDWYRYFANVGTLRVHRWAKNGMKKEEVAELEQAISEIERAIEINPEAHFGREWAQLAFMKAIHTKLVGTEDQLMDAIQEIYQYDEPERVRSALVGLIVLGAAWESPDMYLALGSFPLTLHDASIAKMADLRKDELLEGGSSFVFGNDAPMYFDAMGGDNSVGQTQASLETAYRALRKNADEYHRNRTEFMMVRLSAGRHPDTDPTFWEGYVETGRVDLGKYEPLIPRRWYRSPEAMLTIAIVVLSLPFIGLYVFLRRRAKQRALSTLPPGV